MPTPRILMLFLLAGSLTLLSLTAFGLGFEDALVLSIAALTTTGGVKLLRVYALYKHGLR